MAKVLLPKYTRAKKTKKGLSFFWERPTWAKNKIINNRLCPVFSTALGMSLADAITKANIQNEIFQAWLKNIDDNQVVRGSVRWICAQYKKHTSYKNLADRSKKDYSGLIDKLCLFMPSKLEFGNFLAEQVAPKHVDKLYDLLIKRYGNRQATYAMQVARRVWSINIRLGNVEKNPFSGMGLKSTAKEETRAWTRNEYETFVATAKKMGYQSVAIAARLAFELCAREGDCIGSFLWSNYIPRTEISYKQNKTGVEIIIPLSDSGGLLFPELEEELGNTIISGPLIVMRDKPDKKRRTILPYQQAWFIHIVQKIRDKAKLPFELKFMGLRHGGATELTNAGASEREIIAVTGHKSPKMLVHYAKKTQKQRMNAARKRRALKLEAANLSE